MLFELACAILIMGVVCAIILPLFSEARILPARGQYDRAIYRDQLHEVDRDVARGLLDPQEAQAARLEIQRRLLAVDITERSDASRSTRGPFLAAAIALSVMVCAGGLYLRLGAPALPDVPFASRPAPRLDAGLEPGAPAAAPHSDVQEAAERLEQKLRADPSNAVGWTLLARTKSMLGDWSAAADAYKRAIDLGQKGSDVLAGYGEMQVMAASGIVSPTARDAFTAALSADTGNGVSRYYLALADAQAGDARKAIAAWVELAAGLREGSPMRAEIARRVEEAAKASGFEPPPMPKGLSAEADQAGPTLEQVQAAAAMSPAERDKMVTGMIEKLAAKMQATPNDLDGWIRLGDAYSAIGQPESALDAYDHANALKPEDAAIGMRTLAALISAMKPGDQIPPRAVNLLTNAAAVAPDAPEVLWYSGVLAVRDGRFADARATWTKLLATLPSDSDDAKTVRSALDEMKTK